MRWGLFQRTQHDLHDTVDISHHLVVAERHDPEVMAGKFDGTRGIGGIAAQTACRMVRCRRGDHPHLTPTLSAPEGGEGVSFVAAASFSRA